MREKRQSTRPPRRRNGIAAVETAVTLPLVLLLTLATLDVCDGIFLKQKAEIAAYEGARVAVGPNASPETVRQAVGDYLDSRQISYADLGSTVMLSDDPTTTIQLDPITVTVEIDLAENRRLPLAPFQFIQGSTVVAEVTMLREGD